MKRLIVLGLGSNIGDKDQFLKSAIDQLSVFFGSEPNLSSVYETAPVGFESDSTFLNQCVSYSSDYAASKILKKVLIIEKQLGRERSESSNEGYASRTIDIDILFIGDEVYKENDLIVPHPRLHERNFVLQPLSEIVPDLVHPTIQTKVLELLRGSKDHNCVKKNEG